MKNFFSYFLLSIMLLSASCEVILHTCGQVCELTELANESPEEKSKEEIEETKEIFAYRSGEYSSIISAEYNHEQETSFLVNSAFNEIPISLPELPPEL